MLRYRGYDWALVHGESRFEVHINRMDGHKEPIWWLTMEYVALGPEWRRCEDMQRPRIDMQITSFDVEPGDWRNLSRANFWNMDRPDAWASNQAPPHPGWMEADFRHHYAEVNKDRHTDFGFANWRVVRRDGALFTVEVSGDTDPRNNSFKPRELAATAPGTPEPLSTGEHELYVVETIPFGIVRVTVPRNSRDPAGHASALAHHHLGLGEPDLARVHDFKDSKSDRIRGDLYVHLHYFGYHGT